MNTLDHDVLHTALDWQERGHRVVLVTLTRTWGSAPRPPGSLMAIRADGQVAGSVSGGCIEDDLIERITRQGLHVQHPQVTTYGGNAQAAQRFGLPCGGTVELVLEPVHTGSLLRPLVAHLQQRTRVERQLHLPTGVVQLHVQTHLGARLRFDGHTLHTQHGPRWRLLLIGGGQLSQCVARMALMLDYQVTVCEPRTEYHEAWHDLPQVTLSTAMPDDLVLAMQLDAHSAVLALTHDPKLDDLALLEALRTPAFYVGAIGSRHNHTQRRQRLLQLDMGEAEVNRLHGPIGLNMGALTPPEIALSVLSELTALQRGADLTRPLNRWGNSQTVCSLTSHG